MSITDRIVRTMQQKGLKQVDIVLKTKVSKGTVSLWVSGQTVPSGENLVKLANALGVDAQWLQTGKESRKEPTYNLDQDVIDLPKRKLAPIISYVQAGNWCELVDAYPVGSGSEFIEIDAKWSDNTYVLRVRGDSMSPTLTEGSLIIVDPQVEWMHNRIVVVRQKNGTEVTVKRLIKDGDTYYLKPDNPSYPILRLEEDSHICGVVVEQITRFV